MNVHQRAAPIPPRVLDTAFAASMNNTSNNKKSTDQNSRTITPWLADFCLEQVERQQNMAMHKMLSQQPDDQASLSSPPVCDRPRMLQILSRGGDFFANATATTGTATTTTTTNNSSSSSAWFYVTDGQYSIKAILTKACRDYMLDQQKVYKFVEYSRNKCGVIQQYKLIVHNNNTSNPANHDGLELHVDQWEPKIGVSELLFGGNNNNSSRPVIQPITQNVDIRHAMQPLSQPQQQENNVSLPEVAADDGPTTASAIPKVVLGSVYKALANVSLFNELLEKAQMAFEADNKRMEAEATSSASASTTASATAAAATAASSLQGGDGNAAEEKEQDHASSSGASSSSSQGERIMGIDEMLETQPDQALPDDNDDNANAAADNDGKAASSQEGGIDEMLQTQPALDFETQPPAIRGPRQEKGKEDDIIVIEAPDKDDTNETDKSNSWKKKGKTQQELSLMALSPLSPQMLQTQPNDMPFDNNNDDASFSYSSPPNPSTRKRLFAASSQSPQQQENADAPTSEASESPEDDDVTPLMTQPEQLPLPEPPTPQQQQPPAEGNSAEKVHGSSSGKATSPQTARVDRDSHSNPAEAPKSPPHNNDNKHPQEPPTKKRRRRQAPPRKQRDWLVYLQQIQDATTAVVTNVAVEAPKKLWSGRRGFSQWLSDNIVVNYDKDNDGNKND